MSDTKFLIDPDETLEEFAERFASEFEGTPQLMLLHMVMELVHADKCVQNVRMWIRLRGQFTLQDVLSFAKQHKKARDKIDTLPGFPRLVKGLPRIDSES